MKRKSAFTLIELLTVIAIIAVLAAIISPVFARAREGANRSNDIASMNSLRNALLLYRVDNGGFPPALLGYVNRYQSGPNATQVIPASSITGFLYPKRVDSVNVFKPSTLQKSERLSTNAYWPRVDRTIPIGSAPQVDLNGDGVLNAADDTAGARLAFSLQDGLANSLVKVQPSNPASANAEFYQISGYDVIQNPTSFGGNLGGRFEIRYALFWSNFAIGNTDPAFGSGSPFDDPRQLGYTDPPENTVITWNSNYRDTEPDPANPGLRVPTKDKKEIVLFLGGAARPFSSRIMFDTAWRTLP
jgi:prepilin-type N-terminal cleavage/methylation domain-containing protein